MKTRERRGHIGCLMFLNLVKCSPAYLEHCKEIMLMKHTLKLTAALAAVAALAACTGLPTGTTPGDLSEPGVLVTVVKNGQPQRDVTVFLKSFNGVAEGSYANSSRVGTTAKTDSNGMALLKVDAAAAESGLFGAGYDAADQDPAKKAASANADQVQWFTTPAIKLSNKTAKRANVTVDIGWDTAAFTPKNGATVDAGNVEFSLPTKAGATEYEVLVLKGNVAGSGEKAATIAKNGTGKFTWTGATAGQYNYTGKFFTTDGMGGLQASSSALLFTVK